jgi:hypothetical protein
MARRIMTELKRIRRAAWPAEPGRFQRAIIDMGIGLTILVVLPIFLSTEYSYVLQAALKLEHKIAGILCWGTLAFSTLATSFLIGAPITRFFRYIRRQVPRSWRSLEYRRLTR